MANGWGGARPNSGPKRARGEPTKRNPYQKPEPAQPKAATWMPSYADIAALVEASQSTAAAQKRTPENNPYRLPDFPKRATPPHTMAMDTALTDNLNWSGNAWLAGGSMIAEGLAFLGYAYLSELAQRPEYRLMSEIIATEATRKWIRFKSVGDNAPEEHDEENDEAERAREDLGQDKSPEAMRAELQALGNGGGGRADPADRQKSNSDKRSNEKQKKIKELVDFLDHLGVRARFGEIALQDGLFGRSHLYLDAGDKPDEELATPIGNGRDKLSDGKIGKDFLKGLRVMEPVWTYPQAYNAQNPLLPGWYDPQQWYVLGRQIHVSRLLKFTARPVPDMLKPAYAFGGLSLSQMAKPYIDIWLQTRQSIGVLIHSFSVMVLMTDLATLLAPGNNTTGGLLARVAMFNALRDNQNTFVVNKASEDFKNVSASLAGLHELQAQAQEHMAFIGRYPLVKFTGIQPAGLNASSEGEIRTFYDNTNAYQESFMRPGLQTVVDIAMITLWGARDPDIVFEFVPLWSMSEKEEGESRKLDAETDQVRIDSGVVSPEEVRRKVVADPSSKFDGLNPSEVPDLREEEAMGLITGKGGGAVTKELVAGSEGGEATKPESGGETSTAAKGDK